MYRGVEATLDDPRQRPQSLPCAGVFWTGSACVAYAACGDGIIDMSYKIDIARRNANYRMWKIDRGMYKFSKFIYQMVPGPAKPSQCYVAGRCESSGVLYDDAPTCSRVSGLDAFEMVGKKKTALRSNARTSNQPKALGYDLFSAFQDPTGEGLPAFAAVSQET